MIKCLFRQTEDTGVKIEFTAVLEVKGEKVFVSANINPSISDWCHAITVAENCLPFDSGLQMVHHYECDHSCNLTEIVDWIKEEFKKYLK